MSRRIARISCGLAFGLIILAARAGAGEPPSRSTAPGPDPSASQAVDKLSAAAKHMAYGVLLVGHPERGHGTAFVISRKNRLLATAAHVADFLQDTGAMYGELNGTRTWYQIDKVWYHPNLTRLLDDDLVVRSHDTHDGEVAVPGPDVAVLHVADGPELPVEWELADPEELRNLNDQPVGILGFPGYQEWQNSPLSASFQHGRITALTDFKRKREAAVELKQFVEHTARQVEGNSGSPLFLPNGHVVAVPCMNRILRADPERNPTYHAVRVDSLWELLAYYKLDRQVRIKAERATLRVPTEPVPDPRAANLRRAVALVREARQQARKHDYRKAGEICNEAVQLAPEYGSAYTERSKVRTHYCGENWKLLPPADRAQQIEWALQDAHKGIELSLGKKNGGFLICCELYVYAGCLDNDKDFFQLAVERTAVVLSWDFLTSAERSCALNTRAQARQFLGDLAGALTDYSEAIRLSPADSNLYGNRARVWDRQGRPDLAERDRLIAADIARRSTP